MCARRFRIETLRHPDDSGGVVSMKYFVKRLEITHDADTPDEIQITSPSSMTTVESSLHGTVSLPRLILNIFFLVLTTSTGGMKLGSD